MRARVRHLATVSHSCHDGRCSDGGGIGDRGSSGVRHRRALADAARVLDAIRDPKTGYYDSRDPFTAVPKNLVSEKPYASFTVDGELFKTNPKPLQGIRIAILREHMVKKTLNHEAISDQIDEEIKAVLRDRAGAELVETITADYPEDP